MNPYHPPEASLTIEPVPRPQRPRLLKVGIGLLAFEMIGNLLLTLAHVWLLKHYRPAEDYSSLVVASFGVVLLEAPLLWLLARGANWARYVAAVLIASPLYGYASRFPLSEVTDAVAYELARDGIGLGLMVAGCALLFTPSVAKWFHQVRTLR